MVDATISAHISAYNAINTLMNTDGGTAILGVACLASVVAIGNWAFQKSHERGWAQDVREQRQRAVNRLHEFNYHIASKSLVITGLAVCAGIALSTPLPVLASILGVLAVTVLTLGVGNYLTYRAAINDDGNVYRRHPHFVHPN